MSEGTVKEVTRVFTKSKGEASWTCIVTKDKEGNDKEENIIIPKDKEAQAKLSAIFTGPGKYRIHYKKNGNFWNIASAEKIDGSSPAAAPASTSAPTASKSDNRMAAAICAFEQSARLVAAQAAAGYYKTAGPDNLFEDTALGANTLFNAMRIMLSGAKKEMASAESEGA